MALTLYMHYLSQPSRAIVILMRLSNIPFEEKSVNFVLGETQKDWFTRINPMQQVPVLVEDDYVLTESVAIMHYLCSKPEVSPEWYPSDTRQRGRVDEYLAWQYSTGLRNNAMGTFIAQARRPYVTKEPVDEKELRRCCHLFEQNMDQIENYFLSRGDFLAGDHITLADLSAVCELMQPLSVGYPATRGRRRLTAWLPKVKDTLQPHFDDVHKVLMAFGPNYHRNNWEEYLN